MTLPLRLMILHFSHMGFTDGLTFMTVPPVSLMAPRSRLPDPLSARGEQGPNRDGVGRAVVNSYLDLQVILPRVTS